MKVYGYYQRAVNEDGNVRIKTSSRVCFESTGIKDEYDGKVIWRKMNKDGTPSNVFAEQFQPNMPYAVGKWFVKMDGGVILRKHPQLKVVSGKSEQMTHDEYCDYLSNTYVPA